MSNRHFQYIDSNGIAQGRYSAMKPKQVANKIFSSLIRELKISGKSIEGDHKFAVRECTKGSNKKTFHYVGSRQKLEPIEIKIGSQTIKYGYSNKVMKDNDNNNMKPTIEDIDKNIEQVSSIIDDMSISI
jgi:hypothetical protein